MGESDCVKKVLAENNEQFERRYRLKDQGYNSARVVKKVAEIFDIKPEQIYKRGNQPVRVKARSLICYWAVSEFISALVRQRIS